MAASGVRRRAFLGHAGALGLAATAGARAASTAAVAGANERLSVALIGCGGQGKHVVNAFATLPNVEIAYACDPDSARAGQAKEAVGANASVADLRRVLDDKRVDAVIIATPDHWHAPAAIMACEAGKHVYVEKPCSHSLREGRLLLDAARRRSVVVQHGTQSRSNPFVADAVQMVREGAIGEVLVAKAWNVQTRANIGHMQPSDPPPGVDYDLWVGPAPFAPFQANRFHYNWRWWHRFGNGDVGNDGMHELDYARWGLGVDTLPTSIAGVGGKYFIDDDQEFPDTATLVFEYAGDGQKQEKQKPRQLIFEMRLWSKTYPHNCDSGAEWYGTQGQLFVSKRGKVELRDEKNKPVELTTRTVPNQIAEHAADFIAAIKEGRRPKADIEEAYRSAALVHLGNTAVQLGRSLKFDPATNRAVGDAEADRLLDGSYRDGHWAVPKSLA